jgi:hypothetical protein
MPVLAVWAGSAIAKASQQPTKVRRRRTEFVRGVSVFMVSVSTNGLALDDGDAGSSARTRVEV